MSDDLLAGDSADNQDAPLPEEQTPETQQAAEDDFVKGPEPSGVRYPDWVPGEYHDPAKRGELFNALGLKEGQVLPGERPDYVPEKFWNDNGLALDKFAKSYTELEKKLGGKAPDKPEPPETYEVKPPEGVDLGEDGEFLSEEDVALFKELGLDNDGAQKVADHYWSQVLPVLAEKQTELETQKLSADWKVKPDSDEFKQRLGQVRQWAESNLPEDVVGHLRKSASGVQALWSMMQNKVAPASTDGGQLSGKTDEELQAMVNDDRYHDPSNEAYRAQVQQEFQKRYGT